MRSKPSQLHGWRNHNHHGRSNPGSVSYTPQQPLNASERQPSPLMRWGLSLHMQQYNQKNRAPRFARRIRPVRYAHGLDLSPRYARQEQTGSLRSPKWSSLRSHHQTTPPRSVPLREPHSGIPAHSVPLRCTSLAPHCTQPPYRRRPSHTQTLQVGSQASPLLASCQAAHADPHPYLPNTHPIFLVRSTLTSFGAHQFRIALTTFALTAQTQPGVCLSTPSGGIYISLFVRCHSFMCWLVWCFVWVGWVVLCEQPDA